MTEIWEDELLTKWRKKKMKGILGSVTDAQSLVR